MGKFAIGHGLQRQKRHFTLGDPDRIVCRESLSQAASAFVRLAGPQQRVAQHWAPMQMLREVVGMKGAAQREIPFQILGRVWHVIAPMLK